VYRKIKITIAIFFSLIIILSSIAIVNYQNSGNVSVNYIKDSGKRFTPGTATNTVNLFKNSSVNGNYGNCPVHQESHEIAYDPLNGYIYLSGYSSNLIYVINPETNSVIKCISGLSSPQDILYDNYNHNIYVADLSSNNVSIINTTHNTVVKNIHVGRHPVALAYDNLSKDLYVSNIVCASFVENYNGAFFTKGNITIINTLNNRTVGNINVGKGPRNMLYDKYNNLLYVSNEYSNSISVINASTNKIIKNISIPFSCCAEDLVLDKSNNCIYLTERNGAVLFINPDTFNVINYVYTLMGAWGSVYDPVNSNVYIFGAYAGKICIMNDNKRIENITGIGYPVSGILLPDNNIYITSSCSNNLYVLNATTEKITGMVIVKDYPEKMAYDIKSGNIYITNKYADNVLIMNNNDKIIGKINAGKDPYGIVYDKFNNYIYVANGGSDNVSVINASNNKVIKNINAGSVPSNILLNPFNKNLYVLNFCSKNISIINTLNNKIVGNISLAGLPFELTFDKDNHNIYVTTISSNKSIYVINSNNTVIKTIGTGTSYTYGILYDSQNNLIYVSNVFNYTVCVLNPENNTFISKIHTGPGSYVLYGMFLDTYNNFIYVMTQNNLISINASSNIRMGTVGTGSCVSSALYLNKTNTIYVANSKSGTISKINTVCYSITFIFNNIIKNDPSWVIFNGHYYHTCGCNNKLTLNVTNGTYKYTICPHKQYNLKNPDGTINISADNVIITAEYRNYYNIDVFLAVLAFISIAFTTAMIYIYEFVKSRNKKKN